MKKFLLAFIPAFFFCLVLLLDLPLTRWLELRSIDWRFAWRGSIPATGEVVIVAIDEKSLNAEGRWPWPRKKIGELIDQINSHQPNLLEMDIIFAEPDQDDPSLAAALHRSANTILGYFFFQSEKEVSDAAISPEKVERSFQSVLPTAFPEITGLQETLPNMGGLIANTPQIAAATSSQGYFNAFPDADGTIRRFPVMIQFRHKIFPSMGLETMVHREGGFSPIPVQDGDGILQGMSLGSRFIPTSSRGEVLINYRGGEDRFNIYSATDILHGLVPSEALRGKTILVGATAIGIYDLRVTPISPNLPGVLAQGNLLDNLYRGDFLVQNFSTKLISLGALIVMSLVLSWSLYRLSLLLGLLLTVVIIGSYGLIVQWCFQHGWVLFLVTPILAAVTLYMIITIYRGLTEERQKRELRKAFRSYLHPDIVEEIIKDPTALKLGGQRAECTILFSDVRNFTTISEQMAPETLVQMMNEYFDPISREIIAAGGYIDKFIGDAVMAIFGAPKSTPDHPFQACQAALAMQRKVNELAPHFREKFGIPEFKIGIGLHTGPVIIGNMGTSERLNYTVMGDSVNQAARLESSTKGLGVTILMSEQTQSKLPPAIKSRFIEEISVKGKADKIRVYELLATNSLDSSET